MKTGLVSASFICAVFATSSIADNNKSTPTKDSHIETAADIQYWCKKESYRYFKRKKLTPYNWSVTTIRILNDYHSTGSWRVKSRLIKVSCLIRKGRKAKYTKIEIID